MRVLNLKNTNYPKNIVCIAAHPDDEVLGLGGTLIKHVNSGDKVFIILLSEGESSKIEKNKKNPHRKLNAEECSNIIGSNLYKIFDYPDQELDTIPILEIIKNLEKILKKLRPDIAYVHHQGDLNKDHQIASQSTLTALRPMNKFDLHTEIRSFETPSSTDQSPFEGQFIFKPNFYVSIENIWDKKVDALKTYNKELHNFPHPRSLKSIESLAIKRGMESGFKKAEAFMVLRRMWK